MDWFTDELKQEIREVFEPKYGRRLNEKEVDEIGENFACFIEGLAKTHPKSDKMKVRLPS